MLRFEYIFQFFESFESFFMSGFLSIDFTPAFDEQVIGSLQVRAAVGERFGLFLAETVEFLGCGEVLEV